MSEAPRPPFIAIPYPLDEYLDGLPGDYGKVARRLLRAANWERGASRCGRFQLDAGEALMDERSDELWGGLRLDRDVTAAGRRALIRRVLERLEGDGWVARRAAHASGPGNGPKNGPRNGPSPTVVRFLKFRGICWPSSEGSAQETAQGSAQETAQASGPILPASPPAPPAPPAGRPPRGSDAEGLESLRVELEAYERARGRLGPEQRLGRCGRDAWRTDVLEAFLARHGADTTLREAKAVADDLASKGSPLRSLAPIAGYVRDDVRGVRLVAVANGGGRT